CRHDGARRRAPCIVYNLRSLGSARSAEELGGSVMRGIGRTTWAALAGIIALAGVMSGASMLAEARPVAANCRIADGFASLHDQIPTIVGDCVEDATSAVVGDVQQRTANGVLVWRKTTNW